VTGLSIDSLADSWGKALSVDRKHFNMFFDRMMDGFAYHKIIVDKNGKPVDYVFLEVNNTFEKMTGLKREKIIGKKVTEVLKGIEKDPADWIGTYGKVALTCEPAQFENYAQPLDKWYNVSAYCPEKGYFVALFEDITERKKAEELLKSTLNRFYGSLSSLHGAILLVSADGHVEFANQSFCDYFNLKESPSQLKGLTSEETLEKIKRAYIYPEQAIKRIGEILAAGKPVFGEEVTLYGGRTCLRDFIPLHTGEGKASFSRLWHHMDITKQKQAEDEVRVSEERFRSVLNNSLDVVYRFNLQTGLYEYMSPASKSMLGYEPEELMALTNEQVLSLVYPDDLPALREGLALINKTGKGTSEYRFRKKDGSYVWWSNQIVIVKDQNGKPLYRDGFVRNITERKKTEEALQKINDELEERVLQRTNDVEKTRERLYNVLETLPAYVILLNKDYGVAFANKVFRERFGESHGKRCYEFLFDRNSSCENCETYKVLRTNQPHHWEWTGPDKRDYDIYDYPFVEADGSTLILEMGIDITERKVAEAELKQHRDHLGQLVAERTAQLRESEQRWATTLASIGDAVIATDTEGKITFLNHVAEALTGWKLTEAKGKPINQVFKIVNEKTRREVESPVFKVLKKGVIVGLGNHTILIRKDSTEVPIDDSGAPIKTAEGKTMGVVLVFRDITERKKSEAALQRQAALIDLSPDAIIVRKLDGTITFWSKGAEKLYGYTKEETIGKNTHRLFETQYPKPFEEIIAEIKNTKRWTGEVIHKTKDGREVTVQSWWLVEKTEEGEVTSILESNVDLTERIKAEKEINRLATFPLLNPNPIMETDFKGKITYANPATATLFPEMEKQGINHIFFSNWNSIVDTLKNKKTGTLDREIKVNDHWYHQQIYLVPQTHQIRIYTVDIDELKQAEEARIKTQIKLEENAVLLEEYANQMEELANQRAQQLKDAERMAAIGQTAGMVGHDIRNPLQAITSDMYLISEEAKGMKDGEGKKAILESIDSINENLAYIDKIVSDLQDYTRPLKPNIQVINLSELIQGTILTINIPNRIELITDVEKDTKIKTDSAYLRRILTNLITNAVQAMPNEGKLTVKVNDIKDKTVISVKDTGVGIPEQVKNKLFTPLFTTKSKGQGLGLAVVKRLVEALNGSINFESQENQGTKFTVELPQTK
jgi:PAS domain S-box-containing protein